MRVNKWGNHGWEFLHTITFNYPIKPTNEEKQNYKNLFLSMNNTLPCIYCQKSFTTYSKYIPIDNYLDDRNGLTYWLFIIHNLVNSKLGKETIQFSDVIKKYESYRAKCGRITNENKKEILTCQIKAEKVDEDFIKKISDETIKKYSNITKKYLSNLFHAFDNPNKCTD
jgi:hypothetical protein